jgi:hypothetical protein
MVLLAMISQPNKLKRLNLKTARLYHLPKGVFLHLKYLEKLVLYGNRITGWGNGYEIFGNMTVGKHLLADDIIWLFLDLAVLVY